MTAHLHPDTPSALPLLSRAHSGHAGRFFQRVSTALLLLVTLTAGTSKAQDEVAASASQTGTIHLWGSPQMAELLTLYEQGFHQLHPNVRFENSLQSTVSAVAGVYAKRAEIGLLGREIWPTESEAFLSVTGHPPTTLQVATGSYDVPKATFALMIFVHSSNPIASLTLSQLQRIFSTGSEDLKPLHTWGELELAGTWTHRPIHLYGFRRENDKAQIFSRIVFHGQTDWSGSLVPFDNSAAPHPMDAGERILQAVAHDPDGIGISNVHYATSQVRLIPVAENTVEMPVMPTRETVATRRYPLSRAVYMVIDPADDSPSAKLARSFLHYILSPSGIAAAAQQRDYLPLTPILAKAQLQILDTAAP